MTQGHFDHQVLPQAAALIGLQQFEYIRSIGAKQIAALTVWLAAP